MPVLLWRCGTEAELNLVVGSNLHVCLSISSLLVILLLILLFSSYFRLCFESKCHNLLCWCCANCKMQIYPHWNPGSKSNGLGRKKQQQKKNAGRRPERKSKPHENLGFLWNVSIDPVVALVFHVTFDVYFWVLTGKKQKGNKKASIYICAGWNKEWRHVAWGVWGGR